MRAHQTMTAFERLLGKRGLRFDAVVTDGAALDLLGMTPRTIEHCDVLHPVLPAPILEAARELAGTVQPGAGRLPLDWLRNSPTDLAQRLPGDWRARMRPVFGGSFLCLWCPSREDLLRLELFTLCSRGENLSDCVALRPSVDELGTVQPWLSKQAPQPTWSAHVQQTLADLSRRIGGS